MPFKIWKTVTIKPVTKAQLEKAGINVSSYAADLLEKVKFKKETVDLVLLKVSELGIPVEYPTTDQIYAKAQKLGLELCPAGVGPVLRLQYQDQPLNEWIYIGMKQIADRDGYPSVFELERRAGGLWLDSSWARPGREWSPDDQFAFSLRKSLEHSETLSSFDPLTLISEIRERLDKLEEIYAK